jgi:ADP-dependent NAD(P)H-hydrate dehydratase / NAD(P)H-hydrate epimerase
MENNMQLYQTNQVRELDRIAIQEFDIPGYTLMQKAGKAALLALLKHWPKAKRIVVVCGKGNNAGDGYVIARLAHAKQLKVTVLYLCEPQKLNGDALIAAAECSKKKISIKPFSPKELSEADVIVDALLGTGAVGEIQGDFKLAIEAINSSKKDVLAVDIPSGLNADTGNPLGIAIKANITVTFVGCKQGLFTGHAQNYCGEIIFSNLDLPEKVYQNTIAGAEILSLPELKKHLPPRKKTANKGAYGHVLLIGGDYGMAGAIRMASEACARVGSGLTTVVTRPEHVSIVSAARPELMCYGVNDTEILPKLIERATVIVIGPGLGNSSWSKKLWENAIISSKPKVIDADALNLLARAPSKDENWVLTPHPGEAARLLNSKAVEIQYDRFAAIRKITKNYGGTCVLKGSGSMILAASSKIGICTFGNPGMASGGMGDILSGIIGGLLAQHLSLETAARLGVIIHARAGDLAAADHGERGLLAMDLLNYLGELIN